MAKTLLFQNFIDRSIPLCVGVYFISITQPLKIEYAPLKKFIVTSSICFVYLFCKTSFVLEAVKK